MEFVVSGLMEPDSVPWTGLEGTKPENFLTEENHIFHSSLYITVYIIYQHFLDELF